MGKHIARIGVVLLCVGLAAGLIAVLGCDGGEGVTTGCVKGWVYQNAQGDVIIGSTQVPPDGYSPVEGVLVQIEAHPNLTDTTDSNGEYVICCVPPGAQVIVVNVGEVPVRFSVQVIAGQIVIGGGHIEGGGSL